MTSPAPPPGRLRQDVVDVLEHVWGPVLIGFGFALLFATQDPAQEVILGFVSEFGPPEGRWTDALFPSTGGLFSEVFWRSTMSILLLGSVPVAIWSAARLAVRSGHIGGAARLVRLIPLLAGLATAVILLLGLIAAWRSPEAIRIPDWRFWFTLAMLLPGVAVGFVLHWALRETAAFTLYSQRMPERREVAGALAALALLIVPVIWIGFFAPQRAHLLGPIGVAAAFAIAAAYLLAALTLMSRHAPGGLPLILVVAAMVAATGSFWAALGLGVAGLAVAIAGVLARRHGSAEPAVGRFAMIGAALVAVFGFSAAYLQRTPPACGSLSGCNLLAGVVPATRVQPTMTQAFAQWAHREAPVVRIVAAQGGGLYAAYHTAYYLAARADADPGFARSLFAVSGVSGGSVGAGVFWAIRRSGLCDAPGAAPTCHRDAVKAILRYDFLSPVLATFLFRDAFDTVIPISSLAKLPIDRASVLEAAFAERIRTWAEAAGAEAPDLGWLDTGLADSWGPALDLPVLLLNATEVGTGERQILSPLTRMPNGVTGKILLDGLRDLTVGNAMTISARFPLVTPPARIRRRDVSGQVVLRQLVDGGYFDNSGIETLIEMTAEIVRQRRGAPVEVLVFSVAERQPPITVKGTIAAPLDAFTSAWRARRDLTARRLAEDFDNFVGPPPARICDVRLYQLGANFTVSWFLTAETFRDIEIQIDGDVTPATFAYAKAEPTPRDLCRRAEE